MRRRNWLILVLLLALPLGYYLLRPSAAKLVSQGEEQLRLGNLEAAIAEFTKALERDPNLVQAYYVRALAHYTKGNWAEGMADTTQVIDRDYTRRKAEAFAIRGLCRMHLHDFDSAMGDCEQAICLSPKRPAAYASRGLVKSARGDPAGAIADFDTAIQLDPSYAEAWANRGYERLKLGQINEGRIDKDEALRLKPELADKPAWPIFPGK